MSDLNRRDFLKATGASSAGAVLFAGCAAPDREMVLQAPPLLPEDTATSFESWYASVCRQCDAGCGIIVRVVEGRAKKIEGNPDHPVNRGKMCARGLAGVQELYHPDRLRTPLRRSGPRGSGQYQVITWDEAIQELHDRLKDLQEQGNANQVVMAAEPQSGMGATIVQRFARTYGADLLSYEPMDQTVLRAAMRRVFNQDRLPTFDLARANYVLSIGADFLGPKMSQVQYNRGYGDFRQGRSGQHGYLVAVEPRMSTTGANADEWVPINPGTEGVFALSIASVLVSENLAAPGSVAALGGAAALNNYRPEEASRITGITANRITDIARALGRQKPSVVIGGEAAASHTNGLFNLTASYALNYLLGSVGATGGVQLTPAPAVEEFRSLISASSFGDWQRLADRMRNKQPRPVTMLLLHNVNPLYGLPNALEFGSALKNVPVIVSFSSFLDETSAMADIILPDHSYLERWGDYVPDPGAALDRANGAYETVGLLQPVVQPVFSTQSYWDSLLQIAKRLGGPMQSALPWDDYRTALRAGMQKVGGLNRGSIQASDPERFWVGVAQRGGWWDSQARPEAPAAPPAIGQVRQPAFSGAPDKFPFNLVVFPSNGVDDGRGAHLPWRQMTPDPTTTIMWQSWIEINPKKAQEMGLRTDDVVIVESPHGRLEVPVYVYPGIGPDVVAMPAGQGHSYMGRYAEKRGANPLSILSPQTDTETGGLAWNATRVSIKKTGRRYQLPRLEGGISNTQPQDYDIIQVTDLRGGRQ